MTLSPALKSLINPQTKQPPKSLRSPFYSKLHAIALSGQTFAGELEFSASRKDQSLFDRSPQRNFVEYNRLLFEYCRDSLHQEALNLFLGIRRLGLPLFGSTLSSVLKTCGCLFDHVFGRQVHCECVKSGFARDVSVSTSLVDLYMRTNNVEDGRRVFDDMNESNVVSWTSLLSGYARNKMNDRVLELFHRMQVEGIKPNSFTFSTVLGVLADEGIVATAVQVHTMVIKNGGEVVTSVCNALISMYLKSKMVRDARAVFDGMEDRDSITWNSMVAGYVTNELHMEAFETFNNMGLAGAELTRSTFVSVIKLCATTKELRLARQLHSQVLKNGIDFDHNIRTGLMVAYSKCGEMEDASKIFSMMREMKDVVSWTAMISGHLQNGAIDLAVNFFCQMTREGVRPNGFTYSIILTAQPAVSPFQVHAHIIKTNYEKSFSVGTALLNAYVKKGILYEAAKVFELIDEKDIVAWSAMLAGYAQIGDTEGAVKIYRQLTSEGVKPNEFTFSSVINACTAPSAAVEQGKQFHACSIKAKLNNALCVSSTLVTMYSKKGNIESASEVFKRQRKRDLVSWNSMICGYAQHGHAKKALEVFKEMRRQDLEFDGITFIGVVTACTHAGLVDEGQQYFDIMVNEHHIYPTMEHYSCMVDLYSRAGMLEKAMDIINRMPFAASATVWRTVLAACRVHRNIDLGKLAGEKLISLQPHDSAIYVLLSNMYAATGHWQERARVRKLMNDRKVKKEAGYSWIEVKNKTYSFLAGDISHPQSNQIYSKLEELSTRFKDAGYKPDTSYVLQDIDDEHKEAILSQHSERLAIAFGLVATPAGAPLQIVKNLRVCGDCHTVIKLISKLERRDIVVRDTNRFHHFKEGLCSCGDYW